jgi:hypothetical protein
VEACRPQGRGVSRAHVKNDHPLQVVPRQRGLTGLTWRTECAEESPRTRCCDRACACLPFRSAHVLTDAPTLPILTAHDRTRIADRGQMCNAVHI